VDLNYIQHRIFRIWILFHLNLSYANKLDFNTSDLFYLIFHLVQASHIHYINSKILCIYIYIYIYICNIILFLFILIFFCIESIERNIQYEFSYSVSNRKNFKYKYKTNLYQINNFLLNINNFSFWEKD